MTEINLLNPLQYNGEKLCIEYINNQPYFSAKQICRILQHTNYRSAVRTYCFPEGVFYKVVSWDYNLIKYLYKYLTFTKGSN